MTKNKTIFLAILFGIFFVVVFNKKTPTKVSPTTKVNEVIYYDEKSFTQGVSMAEKNTQSLQYKVRGGVVPHHLVASYMIADFFKKISSQKPETLVIVGPNHDEVGEYKVLTSLGSWNTEYGLVDSNQQIIYNLVRSNYANFNDSALLSDQSISALMPYISFYMPYAKVVPLLLSSKMTNEDLVMLSDTLSKLLNNDKTLLIASVDFSHYLSFDQANARDLQSISAIKKFGCKELLSFDSDNLDSPESICTLLYTMLNLGSTNMEILNHDNSAIIQNSRKDDTTSYFSIFFH